MSVEALASPRTKSRTLSGHIDRLMSSARAPDKYPIHNARGLEPRVPRTPAQRKQHDDGRRVQA